MAEMDRTVVKDNPLKALGLESLDEVSLRQLSDAIAEKLPWDMGKRRHLDICVMWLHSRLMSTDVSADGFTDEIGSWYRFLKDLCHRDRQILEAFHGWQRKQATIDPASSRRLSIAEAELRKLMHTLSTSLGSISKAAGAEQNLGRKHEDRGKLQHGNRTVIEIEDDDDDDDDVVILGSNPVQKDHGDTPGHPNLPFLTGSNTMPLKERLKKAPDGKNVKPRGKHVSLGPGLRASGQESKSAADPKELPVAFVCDRCGQTGETST